MWDHIRGEGMYGILGRAPGGYYEIREQLVRVFGYAGQTGFKRKPRI